MLKLLGFVGLVALSLGILSGVIEINFHAEELSTAPSRLMALVTNEQTLERVRSQAVRLKRAGEQKLIGDADRRLELALLYAKTDAVRLQDLLAKNPDTPDRLLPQSELLAESLQRLQSAGGASSEEALVSYTDKSKEALTQAKDTLTLLEDLRGKHEDISAKFAAVTQQIRDSLGQVAGTQDKTPGESSLPQEASPAAERSGRPSPIPLKF